LLHRFAHVFVRLFHRVVFLLLRRREQRPDLGAGAFHDRVRLLHRLFMDRFDLRFGLVDDRLHLRLLVVGELEVLAQMLERILHHLVMHFRPVLVVFMLARLVRLKECEPAERYHRGGHECHKFSCHCLFVACFGRK
jgi:hypothetical protein